MTRARRVFARRVGAGLLFAVLVSVGCSRRARPESGFGDAGLRDAATPSDGGTPRTDAGIDASSPGDAGHDAGGQRDGGPRDGGTADVGRDAGASPLDPQLDVPPASNDPCGSPGSLSECSGIAVCRFFSPDEGRCESCTGCGNLFASCASGEDCDILFVCFQGQCTNFCTLGTSECGRPADCIDIGHPTRGACRPQ